MADMSIDVDGSFDPMPHMGFKFDKTQLAETPINEYTYQFASSLEDEELRITEICVKALKMLENDRAQSVANYLLSRFSR